MLSTRILFLFVLLAVTLYAAPAPSNAPSITIGAPARATHLPSTATRSSSVVQPSPVPATRSSSVVQPSPVPATRPPAASMSTEILRLVNQHRRAIGRPPLQPNSFISSVALGHSRDMLSGRSPFGHDGFHDRIDRIRKKLGPLHIAAENVASGPMSAHEVVDGWLHSPGHRRNIEGDFRLTGIGLAFGRNGNIFFTQIFAK